MNDRYLSLREVSRILGVTSLTLRNWDRKGSLAAYRNPVNNYRVYRYADVADFLTAMRQARVARSNVQKLAVRVEEEESPIIEDQMV